MVTHKMSYMLMFSSSSKSDLLSFSYVNVNVIFICIALLKQHKLTNVLYILAIK